MTSPIPTPALVVRPDDVAALAAELAALATQLSGNGERCRGAGPPLTAAFAGDEGWAAGRVAHVWGSVLEVVAARTAVLAGVLGEVAESYRAAEALRADRIPAHLADRLPGHR